MTAATSSRPDENLLSRKEFARLVGVSEWDLRMLHHAGVFEAFVGGKSGRGHASRYHVDQVNEFRAYQAAKASGKPHEVMLKSVFTSEQAQACFKAFDEGWTLRRCVAELGYHPDVVVAIRHAYERLDQGVFLSHALLERADAVGLDGPSPMRTSEDVIVVLEKAAARIERLEEEASSTRACRTPSCKSEATYCPACVAATLEQACEEARAEGAREAIAQKAKAATPEGAAASPVTETKSASSAPPAARAPGDRSAAPREPRPRRTGRPTSSSR